MKPISEYPGRKRVVVERVIPGLPADGGMIKRPEGTEIPVRAHVYGDSHDVVTTVFRWRRAGETGWNEARMHAQPNDEFTFFWRPPGIGLYEYRVAAWTDAFASWQEGFAKKADSGQSLDVEFSIGSGLVAAAAARATGAQAKQLKAYADFLGDSGRDWNQRVQLARGRELADVAGAYPDREMEVEGGIQRLFVERWRAQFSTWYEFFPRSCSDDPNRHGTFADAARRLPEIAAMGFDVVYLPPIHPIGRAFRKGRNNALEAGPDDVGSPWAIGGEAGGHKSVNPDLGTLDDFRAFIAAAAAEGLEIAIDIAFQCSPDHPYVKKHPEWFRWRPDGTVQYAENPPKKYQDILPFDFESTDWKSLWKELKSVFEFWIEQGVKIFRVDNPHTKSFLFWEWCLGELKRDHPETIYLAEAFTRPKRKYRLARHGFTQGYTYFTWRNDARVMREYLEELTQREVAEYFWPNFWPNTPDILHADLQHGNRATFIGRYVLAATLSSSVGIYGPAYEVMDKEPFPGKEEYNHNEKYELKLWDRFAPGNIREEITLVNRARHGNPALQQFRDLIFLETDNPAFIAYIKRTPDRANQVLVVVNMDWQWTQSGHVFVPVEELGLGSDQEFGVRDLLDPQTPVYRWKGVRNFVKLDPRKSPAHLFQVVFDV
ncbi:MAG: DUF3416 domain-containing protein [Opitutales bacterium]|nr:DUF3416 domain-containing protein [Opitutales bacterium]